MNKIRIDKLVRTRRRTIELIIERDASLTVRAPLRTSKKEIMKLVEEKRKWIEAKQEIALEKNYEIKEKKFVEGEEFLFLGKPYKLLWDEEQELPLIFDKKNFILDSRFQKYARDAFIFWYKDQAYHIISQRADFIASFTGIHFRNINISNAKKRWASCSSKGDLNFAWRLIMAPIEVVDYVIIHEMVHLVEMSHSKAFWKKVEKMMPDYKKYKTWLKNYGHLCEL